MRITRMVLERLVFIIRALTPKVYRGNTLVSKVAAGGICAGESAASASVMLPLSALRRSSLLWAVKSAQAVLEFDPGRGSHLDTLVSEFDRLFYPDRLAWSQISRFI